MKGIRLIRGVLFGVVLLAGFFTMPGCNTIEGAGKDTERAGEHIQDAAQDAKH